jgi:hypothetical protein
MINSFTSQGFCGPNGGNCTAVDLHLGDTTGPASSSAVVDLIPTLVFFFLIQLRQQISPILQPRVFCSSRLQVRILLTIQSGHLQTFLPPASSMDVMVPV